MRTQPTKRDRPRLALLAAAAGALLSAFPAQALQPLEDFLAGARQTNPSGRQAALTAEQRAAEATGALGSLLPSLSAAASLTRNQKAAAIDVGGSPLTIQPRDQITSSVSLSTPVLDAAGWARLGAARATATAARASATSTDLQVQGQVATAYYQVVGAASLVEARTASLAAAEKDLALVRTRRAEGAATDLDVARAEAEAESVRQGLADATLTDTLARRSLETLSGLVPEEGATATADDLHEEPALAWWLATGQARSPALASAAARRQASEAQASAARLGLLPTVSASATQHYTNAGGLTGQTSYHTLTANLSWTLDLTSVATVRAQAAAEGAARASESASAADVRDTIHESWQRVATGLAKCRSTRAQDRAATQAVEAARVRYEAGAGTQLELLQAERDQRAAASARIQADADLATSRAALRLAAGLGATALVDAAATSSTAERTTP